MTEIATTGPDLFREALRLREEAHQAQSDNGPGCGSEEILADAQVCATLALAAAQVLPTVVQMMGDNSEVTEWARATGVHDAIQQENGRLAEDRPRQRPTEVDPFAEGCVDHEPTALPGCPDCARRQGVAR